MPKVFIHISGIFLSEKSIVFPLEYIMPKNLQKL